MRHIFDLASLEYLLLQTENLQYINDGTSMEGIKKEKYIM